MTAYPIDATVQNAGRLAGRIALGVLVIAFAGCGNSDDSGQANRAGGASSVAVAAETANGMATGATMRRRIAGNTVTGIMAPGSRYTEYYAPDGTIRGAGYQANWAIDGDRMCLDYDDAANADCYAIEIDGNAVEWHRDGEVQGEGRIVAGNPNHF